MKDYIRAWVDSFFGKTMDYAYWHNVYFGPFDTAYFKAWGKLN